MVKREAVLEAIRKAAGELGRAPSRAELKRLTGVSHFMVLKQFATLREAVQAAGFTPHIKGRRATTAELLEDFDRVARKLGKQPSRAEYLREGKYSAGTYRQRFGSWVQAVEDGKKALSSRHSAFSPATEVQRKRTGRSWRQRKKAPSSRHSVFSPARPAREIKRKQRTRKQTATGKTSCTQQEKK